MADEKSNYVNHIKLPILGYNKVQSMESPSQYVYYSYLIYHISILITEYEYICNQIVSGEPFNVKKILGVDRSLNNIDYDKPQLFFEKSASEIEEIDRAIGCRGQYAIDILCDNYKPNIVKNVLHKISTISIPEEKVNECDESIGILCANVRKLRAATYDRSCYLHHLIEYFFNEVIDKINYVLDARKLKEAQSVSMIDILVEELEDDICRCPDIYYEALDFGTQKMMKEYIEDRMGYSRYTQEDLLERELYKFIGEFIDTGFLSFFQVDINSEKEIEKIWNKFVGVEYFKGKEYGFKQFNCFFQWNGKRFVLNKVSMAEYIIKFRHKLTLRKVDEFVDFYKVMNEIYKDVDELDRKKKPKQDNPKDEVLDGLKEMVDSFGDDKFAKECTKGDLKYFFEKLLADKERAEVKLLEKGIKGTRSATRWNDKLVVGGIIRMIGALERNGWLKDLDNTYLDNWLKSGHVDENKTMQSTWRKYRLKDSEEGKWTRRSSSVVTSDDIYDYIDTILNQVSEERNIKINKDTEA